MFGFLRRKKPVPPTPEPPGPSPAAADPVPGLPPRGSEPAPVLGPAGPARTDPTPARIVEASGESMPEPQAPSRTGWISRLRQGLSRTSGQLAGLFGLTRIDETLFEDLETALLTADTGIETTTWLLARLRERVKRERLETGEDVRQALRAILNRPTPQVWMVTGVNGAGKTTSIGKLAHLLRREHKSVLLAAGDTFRAAARAQLAEWGARNDVAVIAQDGADPGAVAFDAVSAGIARRTDIVMVDTAGRLPTQTHLMEELRKVRRVIGKALAGAPHEALLVLDGNTGQNMLAQVAAFDAAVALTGLLVTKLDGTAKGGAIVALAHTRRAQPIPVYFIGLGEGVDDLQAFSAQEFVTALLDAGTRP